MADNASISSYSSPASEPVSPTAPCAGGFILAVDADFDPEEGLGRAGESPGYEGTLKVRGSLLWDDLAALVATQTQHLSDLWPLALKHPQRVYVGPVVYHF